MPACPYRALPISRLGYAERGEEYAMHSPHWFEHLDQVRRFQGNTLDRFGLGPRTSPFEVIATRPGMRVRCYGIGAADKAPLLIVPAPIKQPYIWDISPERSVVRHALDEGLSVFMVEWIEPTAETCALGLADYAGSMLYDCCDLIAAHTSHDQVFLTGHSLGGIFAAIFSAYRPDRVAALALIDAPLDFDGRDKGLRDAAEHDQPLSASGTVPGSLLSMLSAHSSPQTYFLNRYADYVASMGSREHITTHYRVARWTMDEQPMARKLFDDVINELYRHNRFMRGELDIGGKALGAGDITAPLVSVFEPASTINPRASAEAFYAAVGSEDKQMLAYPGDVGVALQHVGPLVGDNAFLHIWPQIFAWFASVGHADDEVMHTRAVHEEARQAEGRPHS
ncbi:MAG: alpha/beta fold hydrolase [Massilia sp.]